MMTPDTINSLINIAAMLLLVASLGVIASPQLFACIRFYALHSFALAFITVLVSFESHVEHLLIPAVLTFVLKTILIPQVFYRTVRRLGIRREVESYINIPLSLLLAVFLVFISFYVTGHWKVLEAVSSKSFFPIAISTLFLGMLMMTTRKKAITQIIGLLLMENGLFLMAVTMTYGMPLLVELGVFFDILVGVLLMGIFVFKISGAFDRTDTDQMTSLKD